MVWWSSASAEQLRRYELRRLARAFERLLRALGEDPVLFQSAIADHGALPSQSVERVIFDLPFPTSRLPCIAHRPYVWLSLDCDHIDPGCLLCGNRYSSVYPYHTGTFEFRPHSVDTERLYSCLQGPSMGAMQFTRAWLDRTATIVRSNGADIGWLRDVEGTTEGPGAFLTYRVEPVAYRQRPDADPYTWPACV